MLQREGKLQNSISQIIRWSLVFEQIVLPQKEDNRAVSHFTCCRSNRSRHCICSANRPDSVLAPCPDLFRSSGCRRCGLRFRHTVPPPFRAQRVFPFAFFRVDIESLCDSGFFSRRKAVFRKVGFLYNFLFPFDRKPRYPGCLHQWGAGDCIIITSQQ